jgi:hypothetical protein
MIRKGSIRYGIGTLGVLGQYRLDRLGVCRWGLFRTDSRWQPKQGNTGFRQNPHWKEPLFMLE